MVTYVIAMESCSQDDGPDKMIGCPETGARSPDPPDLDFVTKQSSSTSSLNCGSTSS